MGCVSFFFGCWSLLHIKITISLQCLLLFIICWVCQGAGVNFCQMPRGQRSIIKFCLHEIGCNITPSRVGGFCVVWFIVFASLAAVYVFHFLLAASCIPKPGVVEELLPCKLYSLVECLCLFEKKAIVFFLYIWD